MNRHDVIRQQLDFLEATGILQAWSAGSPGDQGKRWAIRVREYAPPRYYSTHEIEIWIAGAMIAQALIAESGDAPGKPGYSRVTTDARPRC